MMSLRWETIQTIYIFQTILLIFLVFFLFQNACSRNEKQLLIENEWRI